MLDGFQGRRGAAHLTRVFELAAAAGRCSTQNWPAPDAAVPRGGQPAMIELQPALAQPGHGQAPLTLAQTVDLCDRHEIPAVGLWRDRVAELGVTESAAAVRRPGCTCPACAGAASSPTPTRTPAGRGGGQPGRRRGSRRAAADTLVLVSGGLVPGSRDLSLARRMIADGIGAIVPRAAELGVRLGIESLHPMFCADRCVLVSLGDAVDLALQFPADVVGVVVDTYNVWWDSRVAGDIARASGRIVSYQLGDWLSPLPADTLLGRGQLGDGHVDFGLLTRQVLAAGYDGYAEVEIFNQDVWATPADTVAAAVRARFARLLG